MNDHDSLIWAAGLLDGCGYLIISVEQGPTRMYHAITLLAVTGDAKGVERMIDASGNGGLDQYSPSHFIWSLQGIAAIKGFLADVWPYLLPATRSRFNMEIRRYRLYTKGQIAS